MTGDPERQPVSPFPLPAAELLAVPVVWLPVPVAEEFDPGVLCVPVLLDPELGLTPDSPAAGLVVFWLPLAPVDPGEEGFEAGGVSGWLAVGLDVF